MADTATRRLDGRIALVTGASRGIGRAVALRFAREGAHLVLMARTQGALEELDDDIKALGGTATLVPGDIRDYEQIDRVGAALFQRYGRLDVLVGNAGEIGTLSPLGHISPEDWDKVMAVNLTANWRLIRSLDPLLRRSEAGRAIFVTSGVASRPRSFWGAYAVSKAGLEMLVRTYAEEVAHTPVRVNLLDPGAVRTRMRAIAFPGEDPERLPTPDSLADHFVALAETACSRHGEVVRTA